MSKLEQVEQSVAELSRDELARFREWFGEFDEALWDRQIEADVKAGRLDRLAEQALAHHRDGRAKPL